MATVNVTFMKCKATFIALAVLLKNKVHGYPPFWVRHVTCLDQFRIRNKHVNKENFLDSRKKNSLQSIVGWSSGFQTKLKVFSVRNVFCSYTKAILSPSRPLKWEGTRANLGHNSRADGQDLQDYGWGESRFMHLSTVDWETRKTSMDLRGLATLLVMSCWFALAHLWMAVLYWRSP